MGSAEPTTLPLTRAQPKRSVWRPVGVRKAGRSVLCLCAVFSVASIAMAQQLRTVPMPDPEMQPYSLAAARDGSIWVTVGKKDTPLGAPGRSLLRILPQGGIASFNLPNSAELGGLVAGRDSEVYLIRGRRILERLNNDRFEEVYSAPSGWNIDAFDATPGGTIYVVTSRRGAGARLLRITKSGAFDLESWSGWLEVSSLAVLGDESVLLARPFESALSRFFPNGVTTEIDADVYRPYSLRVRTDGMLCEYGLDGDCVYCGTFATGFRPVLEGFSPEQMVFGQDGTLWVLDPVGRSVHAVTPDGQTRVYKLADSVKVPSNFAIDPSGAIWLIIQKAAYLVRLVPE